MADEIKLSAQARKDFSGHRLTELRQEGKIPAIMYGPDIENTSIVVDDREFRQVISTEHGENALIKIKVGNKKSVTTIVKEIQVHPVTMKIIHVDFGQIRMTEKVEVDVPVEVEGEAPGVKKDGGVIEHVVREIRVKCLPGDIPDNLMLDISGLNVGEHLKVSDLPESSVVEIMADPDQILVNIAHPTELKEEEEALPAEEAEPEVIGKEPKEEEEPAPAPEKGEKEEPEQG